MEDIKRIYCSLFEREIPDPEISTCESCWIDSEKIHTDTSNHKVCTKCRRGKRI